jgi:hypothetical protein
MKNSTEEVEKPSQTSDKLILKVSVSNTKLNLLTEETTLKPCVVDDKHDYNDSNGTPEKSNVIEEKKQGLY